MPGCPDNVGDCCTNDGLKIGAPAKEKEGKSYLHKLKWFRPNLRLPEREADNVLRPSDLVGWEVPCKTLPGWHGPPWWPLEVLGVAVTVELFGFLREFWAPGKARPLAFHS